MYTITSSSGGAGIAYQLNQNNKNLQRSLQRISTMKRINSAADDSAGLAMSMKLGVQIRRTESVITSMSNVTSYLQTQDGVLEVADGVLERMAELATLAQDTTKSTSDLALYQAEFANLRTQLQGMQNETFNGASLFVTDSNTQVDNATGGALTISMSGQTMSVSRLDLSSVYNQFSSASMSSSGAAYSAATAITAALSNLSSLRATNGSEQNRVGFAADLLEINKSNLEAANSRIVDLDLASEMVKYSTFTFLDDANWALLAQANAKSEKILKLLE